MTNANTKQEHTPKQGDVLVYHKKDGTFSFATTVAQPILWGSGNDDKIMSDLKNLFNSNTKINGLDQGVIVQTIGWVVAKMFGLCDCKIIRNDSQIIVAELR